MSHLHHVVSSPIARLLPPPSPFEPNRSPHIPTMSFRARPLVSHPHRVNSSATARVSPSIRTLRARLLVSDPTVSIRARPLVSRLHQALSSPAASLPPNRVNSSATARVPPSTRSLRARLLVSDSTVSIRAQPLVSRLHQAFSSPATSANQPFQATESTDCSTLWESTQPVQILWLCLSDTQCTENVWRNVV